MTLIDFFDRGARLNPEGMCLVEGSTSLTYTEVKRWTHRISRGLQKTGLAAQAHIAILSHNSIWAYVTLLGIQRVRGVWVPLNARSTIDENIAHMNRTKSEWLFYQDEYLPYLDKIKAEVPSLRGMVSIDGADENLESWSPAHCAEIPPSMSGRTTTILESPVAGVQPVHRKP